MTPGWTRAHGVSRSTSQRSLGSPNKRRAVRSTGEVRALNDDTVTPVTPDGNWAFYSKRFQLDAGASDVVLKDENFGNGAADFDMIQLWAGECPAAPTNVCAAPVPTCRAASCIAGVCASNKL